MTGLTANGTLWLNGTALNVNDTFTQADIDAGLVTYDHDGSNTTSDSFSFSVDDGQGAISGGSFAMVVTAVADAPVARDDVFMVSGAGSISLVTSVLDNDENVERDAVTVVLVSGPKHGAVVLQADGTFDYLPLVGYLGEDSFAYSVSDGTTLSEPALVTLIVDAAVVPPPPPPSAPSVVEDRGQSEERTFEETEVVLVEVLAGNVGPAPRSTEARRAVWTIASSTLSTTFIATTDLRHLRSDQEFAFFDEYVPRSTNRSRGPTRSAGESIIEAVVAAEPAPFSLATGRLFHQLDDLVEELNKDDAAMLHVVAGGAVIASGALSAALVAWATRASYFVTLLSTSLPAWSNIDPIPVLDAAAARRISDRKEPLAEQSLADLVESRP